MAICFTVNSAIMYRHSRRLVSLIDAHCGRRCRIALPAVAEVALGRGARQALQAPARLLVPTLPKPCRSSSRGIRGARHIAVALRRQRRTDFGCGAITS